MVAYTVHILESTKGIEIKLGTYIDVIESTEDKNHNPILHFTCVISPYFFPYTVVYFVMSWCTSGIGLQVLPFIDNSHLGSILHFQGFSCCVLL